MIKRMILMLLIFGLIAGAIAYYKYSQIQTGAAMQHKIPPETVTSTVVKKEFWEETIDVIGSFSPVQGVIVSSEESGKIVEIKFESNQKVSQGDLLVQLDISVEEAQLKAAEARTELAKSNLERLQSLKGTSALPEKDLDEAKSQLKQTIAEIDRIKAIIEHKTIKAPFSGITGIRQIQLGQYLNPGAPIVSLQTFDPIYVDFSIPQQFLSKIKKDQLIRLTVDAFPEENFTGKITAIDAEVDKVTREIHLQATIDNPEEKLHSGMFARVSIIFSKTNKYITIPITAIRRAPYGDSIYVIENMTDQEGRSYLGARQQFVKLGPTRGDQIAVLEGLYEGEEIATSGVFKLRPKAEVIVNNEITPENAPTPQPSDS
jgi:membrane fusion protein (multidrug efflux system)